MLDLCCTFGADDGRADGAGPDRGAAFDPGPVRRSIPVVDADDFSDPPPATSRTRRTDPLRISGPDRTQFACLHVEHLPVFGRQSDCFPSRLDEPAGGLLTPFIAGQPPLGVVTLGGGGKLCSRCTKAGPLRGPAGRLSSLLHGPPGATPSTPRDARTAAPSWGAKRAGILWT